MNIDPSTVLFLGLLLTIAAAGVALARVHAGHTRTRWIDELTWCRIIVHTRDGQSIDGHLAGIMHDGIRLTGAKLVSSDPAQPLAGDVHIHRDRVAWVQTHPDPQV